MGETRLGCGIFGRDSVARATRIASLDFSLTTCHLPERWTCQNDVCPTWSIMEEQQWTNFISPNG